MKLKNLIIGAALAVGVLLTTDAASAQCAHCVIQTKMPSAAGKFEYRVSCIVDISGDEVNTTVVAASDEEAIAMVRQTRC
jgi:hypothetical protein